MIVISPNFVLPDGSDLTADHPVVGWQNLVTPSTIAADSAADNFPASNLANPATHAKWVSDTADEQYVTFTPISAETIDYVAIAKQNFSAAQIAVSLEIDDGSGFVEAVAPFIPGNDEPLLFRLASGALASVRLRLQASPLTVAPQMAVMYVGSLLVLPRKLYQGMASPLHARTVKVTNGQSESGSFLGRIVTQRGRNPKVPLSLIDPDYYRAHIDDFIVAAKSQPFFFGWRPQTYPDEIVYASMTNDPLPQSTAPHGLISMSLEMSAVA